MTADLAILKLRSVNTSWRFHIFHMKWNWLDLTFEMSDFPHDRDKTNIRNIRNIYRLLVYSSSIAKTMWRRNTKIESLAEIHLWKKQKLSNEWITAEIRVQLIWDICVIKDFEIRMIRYTYVCWVYISSMPIASLTIGTFHCCVRKINLLAWIYLHE